VWCGKGQPVTQPTSHEPFWHPNERYKYRDGLPSHPAETSCNLSCCLLLIENSLTKMMILLQQVKKKGENLGKNITLETMMYSKPVKL